MTEVETAATTTQRTMPAEQVDNEAMETVAPTMATTAIEVAADVTVSPNDHTARGTGASPANPTQTADDELESMAWWDALTPGQQRAMMKRFVVQPPAPAPAPSTQQPIVIQAPPSSDQPRRRKMKRLHIEDFSGKSSESVEAWLATIPQEVERQAGLGGDSWTAEELYYEATAHLKDAASKWLITLTEHMQPEDRNLSYLVRKMRKKYGSRDNMFRIQQRLAARVQQPGERLSDYAASLTNIGFGKRIPAESYVEAFINGINNETTATQVRAYEPQTLDEAVQFAEDKCGEYGEGFKVTDWRVAKRRYRENREYGEEGDASPPKKKSTNEAAEQLDWRQLGLGFGGEEPPSFDTNGKAVSGLAKTAKKDPLSLAALQALMLVSAGLGKDSAKATSGNLKAAQARKIIEAENNSATGNQQPGNDAAAGTRWQGQNRNGNTGGGSSFNGGGRGGGGRGFGGFGGGRGRGGRTGLENYGPQDTRFILQRKAESACNYCGEVGHWWRECHKRLADEETAKRHQTVPAVTSDPGANGAAGKSGGTDGQRGAAGVATGGEQKEALDAVKTETKSRKRANEVCMPVMMSPVDDDEFMPAKKVRTKKQKLRAKLSLSGGRTVSERRRQRRASVNLAAVHGILVSKLRERREERAKVLRKQMGAYGAVTTYGAVITYGHFK
ncbi:hypothetical protein PInf_002495 [Phytophthora infestans]|nr:hypothetical protein PInf_002495 [Phytophthora infestans]